MQGVPRGHQQRATHVDGPAHDHREDSVATSGKPWPTTYVRGLPPTLTEAGEQLVQRGLAEVALAPDGNRFWRARTMCDEALQAWRSWSLPARGCFTSQGSRCHRSNSARRRASRSLRGASSVWRGRGIPPYLHAALGECVLAAENETVRVHPLLRLYEIRILSISFRIFGAEQIAVEEFIDRCIALPTRRFERVYVSPGFARIARSNGFALGT